MVNREKCIVDDCQELFFSKGYCRRHYYQVRRHGKIVKSKLTPYPLCKIEWCNRPADAGNGYCSQHLCQIKRFGEVRYSGHNPNEIIKNQDGTLGIVLRNREGVIVGTAIIDAQDLDLVTKYKWFLDDYGYAQCKGMKKNVLRLHQLINPDFNTTDHIDKNKLNNRRSNLRECTHQQNCWNYGIRSTNTSGFIGVSEDKKHSIWYSQIVVCGEKKDLGRYRKKEDAIKARLLAEKKHFGEFAPQQHLYEKYGI